MDPETLQDLLQWATLINLVLMVVWLLAYLVVGEWARGLYAKWFPMPEEAMSRAIFIVVGMWGTMWVTFFLAPLLATYIMG